MIQYMSTVCCCIWFLSTFHEAGAFLCPCIFPSGIHVRLARQGLWVGDGKTSGMWQHGLPSNCSGPNIVYFWTNFVNTSLVHKELERFPRSSSPWSSCAYQKSAKLHSSLRDICWANHGGMILEGVIIEQNIKNIRTSAVISILSEKIKKNHHFDFVNLFYLYKLIIKIFPISH